MRCAPERDAVGPKRRRTSREAVSVGRRRDEPAVTARRPIPVHRSGGNTKCLRLGREGPQCPQWRSCFAEVSVDVSHQGAHQQPVLRFKEESVGPTKASHASLLRRLGWRSALWDSGVHSTSGGPGAVSRAGDGWLKPYSNCGTIAMVRVGGSVNKGGPCTTQGSLHIVIGATRQAIGYHHEHA